MIVVKLLRDSRIIRRAGEIVEVTPAEASFLTSVGSAVRIDPPKKEPKKGKK